MEDDSLEAQVDHPIDRNRAISRRIHCSGKTRYRRAARWEPGRAQYSESLVASSQDPSLTSSCQILPFAIAPLVIFTSQHSIMSVPKTVRPVDEDKLSPTPSSDLESSTFVATTPQFWPTSFAELKHALNPLRRRHAKDPEYVSFANGMAIIYLATSESTLLPPLRSTNSPPRCSRLGHDRHREHLRIHPRLECKSSLSQPSYYSQRPRGVIRTSSLSICRS